MTVQKPKNLYNMIALYLCAIVCLLGGAATVAATTIHDFVTLTPYLEIEGGYDDNVFELADDATLPENGKEREDIYLGAKAGVGVNIALERPYLTLGIGMNYSLAYLKYTDNSDLDDVQNNLDVDLNFASKYEEGLIRDRLKVNVKDVLSLIPIDEEEPLLSGNRALRNDFTVGGDYKLISTRKLTFTVGYAYSRIDFFEDDRIEVVTVRGYEDSDDLTQESQTHTGKVDFQYILNPRLTYSMTYSYNRVTREENPGELVSANFIRHHVLGGLQAKLTPRIESKIQGGYGWTIFDDVNGLSQNDQNDFVADASVTANFAHQPIMTAGYRKYFTENDFGDTLLTDNLYGRMGFKIVRNFLLNFSGDYILEARDLMDDETTQKVFGVNAEYTLLKNMKLMAGYNYRQKDFFTYNFLGDAEREETSHVFLGGFEYKVGRYVLLKGMYSYTDKTSDISEQEFSRNKFTASGKVIF